MCNSFQIELILQVQDFPPVGNFPGSEVILEQTGDMSEIQMRLRQIRGNEIQLDAINRKYRELCDTFKSQK